MGVFRVADELIHLKSKLQQKSTGITTTDPSGKMFEYGTIKALTAMETWTERFPVSNTFRRVIDEVILRMVMSMQFKIVCFLAHTLFRPCIRFRSKIKCSMIVTCRYL